MTVLRFFSAHDDPVAWERALRPLLPGLDFRLDGPAEEVEVVLAWQPPPGFFAGMSRLRLVVNLGAGVDKLLARDDLPPVPVSRLNDQGMVRLMSSWIAWAVTGHARDTLKFAVAQRRGEWRYIHPRPLSRFRVGVLGLGELGAPAARLLATMGYDVRGWSRTPKEIPGVRCQSGELREFLAETDICVLLLPLTPQTRGVMDAAALSALPRGACLVNASRGALVDEAALIEALRSGHIAEATLDAFAVEPLPPGHPFWAMENVVITPHLASITVPEEAAVDVAESIRRVTRGEAPLHQVDPGRGY
ncbi:2-hydroxyacid dehydrogenase [Sabulicella glaciei]|uniref:Glyoxylate/hydroxypyruvate reductase A n=1 Tax=Sabulicella glaciei TaxID=2984948 RepID=A0ABT3NVU4_9PROT|nr:glyoxylate/hydroxypyruvate reductase A [Roseococcus sp. MDT2-1-1]MCW8086278.1 glyoxylate/hydroxypyruvate reductase A [Roseococcus sp. MDT2-1-1]